MVEAKGGEKSRYANDDDDPTMSQRPLQELYVGLLDPVQDSGGVGLFFFFANAKDARRHHRR